jgi:replication-associated recombination protein RarA
MGCLSKYQPKSLSQYAFASDTLAKASNKLAKGQLNRHLLLYGNHGTGKSTLAEHILRSRYPDQTISRGLHIYEAANWSKSCLVQIENRISWELASGQQSHLTLLNEVDRFGPQQQSDLQAFMDTRPDHQFILTTNFVGKVMGSIASRSVVQSVEMPCKANLISIVTQALLDGGVSMSSEIIEAIVDNCGDSWRRLETAVELQLP